MNVFIGYDSSEAIAFWVLSHSIQKRASRPVSITPIALDQLPFRRPWAEGQSTEFAFSRFLTPYLANYSLNPAIFLDCDMLCTTDITRMPIDPVKAVTVVQHDYEPSQNIKMGGVRQTRYPRKNWSSVMGFMPNACRRLTMNYVEKASGLELHRFAWLNDKEIGSMPLTWNFLVGEYDKPEETPHIIHWTNGGPWMAEYGNTEYADLWFAEYEEMMSDGFSPRST